MWPNYKHKILKLHSFRSWRKRDKRKWNTELILSIIILARLIKETNRDNMKKYVNS